PQAFVLTAIVISFAVTVLLLVLAVTGRSDDQVADPPEDADPHELAAADARFPRAELGAAVRHLATQPQPVLHGSHRHDDREERR
ncbi:cation:proton antiporter, partial [Escherichia coli]